MRSCVPSRMVRWPWIQIRATDCYRATRVAYDGASQDDRVSSVISFGEAERR